MNIDIYAFSSNGAKLCDKIIEGLKEPDLTAYVPEKYVNSACNVVIRQENLYKSTEKSFKDKNCIVFVGAVGIAVRAIAPFVRSKKTDPAVICVDEKGLNVISLLSGHIGGANQLARKIAEITGGDPIITTATDINGKFAVDEWANNKSMHILSLKSARDIAADILENKKIGLCCDFNIKGEIPEEIDINEKEIGVCVSLDSNKKPFKNTLNLIPKIISIGVGCRKGTPCNTIYNAIKDILSENEISHFAINSINSIDLKKEEEGILKTSKIFKVPFYTYTKEELNDLEGKFSNSDFVKSIAGVDSVCERASMIGNKNKKLIISKTIKNSVTVAASIDDYAVNFEYK
ncbi:cobalt-precorrin 5A hydrolase [Sedimentibacter acidaminivorans]|uniref:Cobalt-precorrin 5A hydrolase n=1 Tax=Sedimentibacter acidaminivorans TaxID=913099 RepID=A0ABS4GBJ7_9FIRM|nr:cobalt-precorrin 5A hydrolase [Sedimentibacter acidaminivorans]MBP1925063.1 cobalt-precorrin 5A hydrolase [Sedimentibacter acidaminivorans]